MSRLFPLICIVSAASLLPAAPAGAQYQVKKTDASQADRVRAMRNRPLIFGCGILWDGRSTVYKMPEDFNRILVERVQAAGVTATKFGFDWAAIEAEPLTYNWEAMEKDRGLDRLLSLDIEVVGMITTVPAWASPEFKPGTYGPVEDPEIAELFEAFCTELARRYRGRIDRYLYGHGMDIDFGWMPKSDPTAYARWLERAYRGLKAGNPDCVVSTGGHMGRSTDFLEKLYKEGSADVFDVVAVCPGPAPRDAAQGDEAFDWKKVEDYRAVMVANGDRDKQMWCPEYGWPFESIGPRKQREYATRALDYLVHYEFVTFACYLTMADWHRGDAGLYGLCDKDLEPRPGFEVWTRRVKPLHDPVEKKSRPESASRPTTTKPAQDP